MRGLLPLWVGVGVYALFLLAGNRLLIDPDTHVADHGRAVDPRPSRGAADRHLFLHHARPALDFDAMAGAGAVRQDLCGRSAGAGRWCWRPPRSPPTFALLAKFLEPASERQHDPGVRRRGAGADGAASVGAAACAGDAGDGGLGRRTDRCRRPPRGAVVLAAAADGAVGQSAWRLCLRPGADRADRARCGRQRGSQRAQIAGAALGRVRRCRAGARAAARPMAGMRCWRRKRSSRSAARCR